MDIYKADHEAYVQALRDILDELAPDVDGYGPDKQRASGIGFDALSRRARRRVDGARQLSR